MHATIQIFRFISRGCSFSHIWRCLDVMLLQQHSEMLSSNALFWMQTERGGTGRTTRSEWNDYIRSLWGREYSKVRSRVYNFMPDPFFSPYAYQRCWWCARDRNPNTLHFMRKSRFFCMYEFCWLAKKDPVVQPLCLAETYLLRNWRCPAKRSKKCSLRLFQSTVGRFPSAKKSKCLICVWKIACLFVCRVGMVLPKGRTLESLPVPENDRMVLREVPGGGYVVLEVSGPLGDDVLINQKINELVDVVGRAHLEVERDIPMICQVKCASWYMLSIFGSVMQIAAYRHRFSSDAVCQTSHYSAQGEENDWTLSTRHDNLILYHILFNLMWFTDQYRRTRLPEFWPKSCTATKSALPLNSSTSEIWSVLLTAGPSQGHDRDHVQDTATWQW